MFSAKCLESIEYGNVGSEHKFINYFMIFIEVKLIHS